MFVDIVTSYHRRLNFSFYKGPSQLRRIPVALATQLTGRRYCDEMSATGKKHLDVAISTLFRGYCHVFAVAKLIICTSEGTWKLKLVVVLFNAKPFTRDLPIYNRIPKVPFYIPQGYVKGPSIYRWYVEEPC